VKLKSVKIVQSVTVAFSIAAALWLCGCGQSGKLAAPVIRPAAGTYAYVPTLSFDEAAFGAAIHYTTDGSTPTVFSPVWSPSLPVTVSKSETVRAVAITAVATSDVTTAAYTINLPGVPAPTFSPAPGVYTSAQAVTITSSAPSPSIYYTTDGSTPTTSSTPYTAPVKVTASESLQALAVSPSLYGFSGGTVGGGSYVILNVPSFSVPSGTYTVSQQVALSDSTSGASIYYTTDGTTPTLSSTLYKGPITISGNETLQAVAAFASPGTTNPVVTNPVSATYVIHPAGTSMVVSGSAATGTPVTGASVQIYAVGTNGYNSAATPLLANPLITDATGAVFLPGTYSCVPGSFLYLTASGGVAVKGNRTANPNLAFATVMGPCETLTATSSFVINEATTVATAYALAQFSSGSTIGKSQSVQLGTATAGPADNFSTSAGNSVGLANAMATSQILTNSSTGVAPGNNANNSAIPEWWQVNLVSDLIAVCARSVGGVAKDGSSCGTLFGNVPSVGGNAPADTLQAALALALTPSVPTANIATLYSLISTANAPFTPYPASATAITDFSIAIEYQPLSSGLPLLNRPSGLGIDSLGNVWVGNVPYTSGQAPPPSFLVELTPTGNPIQSGSVVGDYAVTSYSLNGSQAAIGGQVWLSGVNYELVGLLAPSIDANNNVWFNDRQSSVIAEVTGSGTQYSITQNYSNGGNGSAVGYALLAGSVPVSTYVDGSGSVWFDAEGSTFSANCNGGLAGGTRGIGVFYKGDPAKVFLGSTDNAQSHGNVGYIVVDPNLTDTLATGTAAPGSPFVWTLGTNGGANLIVHDYSQPSGTANPSCNTPLASIGALGNSVAGDPTFAPGHSQSNVPDIANPSLSGDALHYLATPEDWTFDNAGNLWIANRGQIDTTTDKSSQIVSSLSKVTPAYGAALTSSSASNFKFSIFHSVAGLLDGSSVTNYPQYLTTDGAGAVWFALSNSAYLNAITSTGGAISPNTLAGSNAGFAGSICACTVSGTTKTYQRPTGLINRPAVDQSGNVWVPSTAGTNYLDVLVGIAAPRVNPDSLGLKTNTFASRP